MLSHRVTFLSPIAGFVLGLFAAPLATEPRADGPKTFTPSGFTIEVSVTVPGTPEEVFDAFTGDITAWWDHHARGIGKVDPSIPTAVEGAWKHFLVEQFAAYVKSGKHKQR